MRFLFKVLMIFVLIFPFLIKSPEGQAQECEPNANPNANAFGGLVSAPQITGFTTSTGVCNQDPSSAFAPYKIPTYDDLKSLYYTQSKALKEDTPASTYALTPTNFTVVDQTVYQTKNNGSSGDLAISGNFSTSNATTVVFVDRDLSITGDFIYGNPNSGLVFVVKGNVNIKETVNRIDAIIISSGFIFTAYQPTDTSPCDLAPSNLRRTDQLVINGSLISLDSTKPIKFCRTLTAGNSIPAEKIVHQVKYLVILRNLLSDTWQRWSEI